MGLRITTWNVNGIRNPFGYQPWRENKTYHAMFDTLDADIVVMQETKIQRKDLQDDMVLVPGWDVFFSLPKHKKGYSGVAIYTRNSKCCPIRAEEGITGVLCPPNTTTKFRELPEEQQIGGYPRPDQFAVDDTLLDSEGRCVVLEFPCFVLIGVYCPATRDATRTEFRQAFIDALDARIRSLVALGKQVFLCGDLNIIRSGLDTAGMQDALKKEGMTYEDFISMPSRRFFNQFVFGGQVVGERDEGREQPIMWDLCREFHPTRQGMYTCWETRKNARPGNFGSRIDYVLCTSGIKDWFLDSNIQEGLLGSDHCPVYATLADMVTLDGNEVPITDLMNPEGMFKDGKRLRDWSPKDILPISAKLIAEFDRRRNIRDMFVKKPSSTSQETSKRSLGEASFATASSPATPDLDVTLTSISSISARQTAPGPSPSTNPPQTSTSIKRTNEPSTASTRPQKKSKGTASKESSTKGSSLSQRSLIGFFKPTTSTPEPGQEVTSDKEPNGTGGNDSSQSSSVSPAKSRSRMMYAESQTDMSQDSAESSMNVPGSTEDSDERIIDPIVSKESWSKLLGKRIVPKCEHEDDCQLLVTKKSPA